MYYFNYNIINFYASLLLATLSTSTSTTYFIVIFILLIQDSK